MTAVPESIATTASDGRSQRSLSEVRASVAAREAALRMALRRLQAQAQHQFALGRVVAEHAEVILAGAFLTGLWLGSRRRL